MSATRDLDALRTEAVLDAHRVGDEVVLPAVVAAGWMIGTAERTHPARTVVEVRDLAVQRGVVFGDDPVGALTLTLDEPHGGEITAAIGSGGPAARYTATLRLDDGGAVAPVHRHDWPLDRVGRGEEDGPELYRRGVQFHGPALQGMRRVLEDTDDRLVVECRLPRTPLGRGAYAGRRHDPVLADVVLQVPPVLGARRLGGVCLPIGVGRIELLAALPADTPFVVVVDRPRPGPMTLRCDATACAPDGRVLQRWSDVDVVTTPDLDERFARSAARHAGAATVTAVAR